MNVLRTLLGKRSPPRTAPGARVYAIGDVHGRPDLLARMLDTICRHDADRPAARRQIILIGDIIDRGPHSREALQMVDEARRRLPDLVVLLGNHEEMLLRALRGDEATLRGWMRVGGAETVQSFGLDPLAEDADAVPFVSALRRAVPPEWIEWIQSWPLAVRSGDYFFCHAGVRPGVALARQARGDLLWTRGGFLEDTRYHGAVVVHGHTITEDVDIRPNRIGVDTGAYASDLLSALCVEDRTLEVLSVRGDRG